MEQIIKWKADDGETYDNEVEALRAELTYWKNKAKMYKGLCEKNSFSDSPKQSSYGSSGGGGHD